jgi:hypothetical protein
VRRPDPWPSQDRYAVARQQDVEVQPLQGLDRAAQALGIVQLLVGQQLAGAGRPADDGIADEQDAPVGPVQRHLARRLARGVDGHQRPQLGADQQRAVDLDPLAFGVRPVGRVDQGLRAGRLAHAVGGASVIAVGQQDQPDALLGDRLQLGVVGFDRVDDQVAGLAVRQLDQVAVEVVAVRRAQLRPDVDTGQDLVHVSPPMRDSATSIAGFAVCLTLRRRRS